MLSTEDILSRLSAQSDAVDDTIAIIEFHGDKEAVATSWNAVFGKCNAFVEALATATHSTYSSPERHTGNKALLYFKNMADLCSGILACCAASISFGE